VISVKQPLRTDGFDLFRLRGVRSLILWKGFPYVFQIAALAVFVVLLVAGWGLHTPGGVEAKLYAKCNLATLVVWGVWWPLMIWLAVLFGRAWCMVCPLELVNNLCERSGRWLGIRQRPLRRWVLSGSLMVLLYAAMQLLVAGAHINRVPAYTSFFLLGLLGLAAVTGLFFPDRAFCRGFCPVGTLLATYGRGGMLAVRAGPDSICRECAGKECFRACNRHRLDARSCPSLLNPPRLNNNRDCLVCCQCFKSCTRDNMRLLLCRPFHPADDRETPTSWPTTLFVMLVSGFVLWELTTEWPKAEEIFLAVPEWAGQALGKPGLSGAINGLWALVLVPLVLWALAGSVVRLLGERASLGDIWRRLALPMAVVVAAGHMSKALAKFASWSVFLPQAVRDEQDIRTAAAISSHAVAKPEALWSLPAIGVASLLVILAGLYFAVREARLAHEETRCRHRLPPISLAGLFLVLVLGWIFAPA
jgi:hypothetical protein